MNILLKENASCLKWPLSNFDKLGNNQCMTQNMTDGTQKCRTVSQTFFFFFQNKPITLKPSNSTTINL